MSRSFGWGVDVKELWVGGGVLPCVACYIGHAWGGEQVEASLAL